MAKNINLFYCIKKNEHRSYTGDYQKFMRRRQALGKTGLEVAIFREKKDAMDFLGLSYNDPMALTIEERHKLKEEKKARKQANIQKRIEESKAYRDSHRKKFYAVARGFNRKICLSWEEAKAEIRGYAFPKWHGCDTIEEAAAYIKEFNKKYGKMSTRDVTLALLDEKLERLAQNRKYMGERSYLGAKAKVIAIANKEICQCGEKYTPYRVHLGPRTPKEAERQYRKSECIGFATCRNIKRHKRGA